MDRDENSAHDILARRAPHTERGGVLHTTQSSVEVIEDSCQKHVQQLNLFEHT